MRLWQPPTKQDQRQWLASLSVAQRTKYVNLVGRRVRLHALARGYNLWPRSINPRAHSNTGTLEMNIGWDSTPMLFVSEDRTYCFPTWPDECDLLEITRHEKHHIPQRRLNQLNRLLNGKDRDPIKNGETLYIVYVWPGAGYSAAIKLVQSDPTPYVFAVMARDGVLIQTLKPVVEAFDGEYDFECVERRRIKVTIGDFSDTTT